MPDAVLLTYLLGVASSLSGYPPLPPDRMPAVRPLAVAELVREACPDAPAECEKLVALYDRQHDYILIRADLDLQQAADNSFLVHEFVHVLEAHAKGDGYQRDCLATLRSEREAYRVQNAYLTSRGRSERYGDMLAQRTCAPEQTAGESAVVLQRVPRRQSDEAVLEDFMEELGRGRAAARRR